MKKLNLLYALLFIAALVSCSKDDEDPTFKKEDFIGVWEENGSEENGCTVLIKFDNTMYYDGEKCDVDQTFDSGIAYTFDNKRTITMSTVVGEIKYVITSLNTTTLKADGYWAGTKIGSYTYTKL